MFKQQFVQAMTTGEAHVAEISTLASDPDARKDIEEIKGALNGIRALHEKFVLLIGQNRFTEAGRFHQEQALLGINALRDASKRLGDRQSAALAKAMQDSDAKASGARTLSGVLVAVALLLSAAVFYSVRRICVSLAGIARQMADSASQVASASSQISDSSQSLAQGASEQAA